MMLCNNYPKKCLQLAFFSAKQNWRCDTYRTVVAELILHNKNHVSKVLEKFCRFLLNRVKPLQLSAKGGIEKRKSVFQVDQWQFHVVTFQPWLAFWLFSSNFLFERWKGGGGPGSEISRLQILRSFHHATVISLPLHCRRPTSLNRRRSVCSHFGDKGM